MTRPTLDTVTVQHFRSFGTETTLRFSRGFNVVCGANGVGKSNVLDSILFACGAEATQMRLATWADIGSRARGGPCAVSVTFTGGPEPLALRAHLKDESSRMLRVNGAAAAVGRVREALAQQGVDVDSPTFCVRQNAAARVLESGQLDALLQQASGAARFHAAVADSRTRLAKEREALARVRSDVATLEKMIGRDRSALEALAELKDVRRRARTARQEGATTDSRLREMSSRQLREQHAEAVGAAAERAREVAALRAALGAVGCEATKLDAAVAATRRAAAIADRDVHAALARVADAEAQLLGGAVQAAEAEQTHRAWRDEQRARALTEHDASLARAQLLGRLSVLREDVGRAAEALAEAERMRERGSGAPSAAALLESVAASEQQLQHGQDVARAAGAECADQLQRLADQLQRLAAQRLAFEEQLPPADAELGALKAARAKAEALAAEARASAPPDYEDALREELARAEEELALAARNEREASLPLRRLESGEANAPSLCSLLVLRAEDPHLEGSLDALQARHPPLASSRWRRPRGYDCPRRCRVDAYTCAPRARRVASHRVASPRIASCRVASCRRQEGRRDAAGARRTPPRRARHGD